jgi:hypothetical protein
MADAKWKFQFRDDQAQFLLAAMIYIEKRCDERISDLKSEAFNSFIAERAKERATELRELIQGAIG